MGGVVKGCVMCGWAGRVHNVDAFRPNSGARVIGMMYRWIVCMCGNEQIII